MNATVMEPLAPTEAAEHPQGSDALRGLVIRCSERASFYRLLGQLYFEPLTQEQIDAMDANAFRDLSSASDNPLAAAGYNDMYRSLRHRHTGTRQILNVDFTGTFYGVRTYEGLTAEPYESLYTSAAGMLMGPARHTVHREMACSGIKVADGIDLPDDHLTFELEYLAVLCERCQCALEAGDRKTALSAIKTHRLFLEEHVLNWFPRFYNLSNKLLETRFYQGVNKVARAFLDSESATISLIAETLG